MRYVLTFYRSMEYTLTRSCYILQSQASIFTPDCPQVRDGIVCSWKNPAEVCDSPWMYKQRAVYKWAHAAPLVLHGSAHLSILSNYFLNWTYTILKNGISEKIHHWQNYFWLCNVTGRSPWLGPTQNMTKTIFLTKESFHISMSMFHIQMLSNKRPPPCV